MCNHYRSHGHPRWKGRLLQRHRFRLASLAGSVSLAALLAAVLLTALTAPVLAQPVAPVVFDFTSSNGQPLNRDDIVDSITNNGITMDITVESNGDHNVAMIFDTSQPGPDPDLGTPNQACPGGGPGVGVGGEPGQPGENCEFQGNALIIPNAVGPGVAPNDDSAGGIITLTFDQPVTVLYVDVLDIEENGLFITFFDMNDMQIGDTVSPTGLGDNSFEEFSNFGADTVGNVKTMRLSFPGSGAFTGIAVVPENVQGMLQIEKRTNGFDADNPNDADVPEIAPGDPITWTYVVSNTGSVTYAADEITVSDDDPDVTPVFDSVLVGDADALLEPGEVWQYIATGTAPDLESADPTGSTIVQGCTQVDNTGQPVARETYANIGTVTAPDASDSDPSHWCNPPEEGIDIEKFTNGFDADDPNGADVPQLTPGDVITWTYLVTNTGDVSYTVDQVDVTDDQLDVTPQLDASSDMGGDGILSPGESWRYVATGTAPDLDTVDPTVITIVDGCQRITITDQPVTQKTYRNIGTVTVPGGLQDSDASHWCETGGLVIQKLTNGLDADDPDGADVPQIATGDTVTWTYIVTNTGGVTYALEEVDVTDSDLNVTPSFEGVIAGDADTLLEPGEVWRYSAVGQAVDLTAPPAGVETVSDVCTGGDDNIPSSTAYVNSGTVSAPGAGDSDDSSYCGKDLGLVATRIDDYSWTYTVLNDGELALENVAVRAGPDIAVACPQTTLAVGGAMTCTASATSFAYHTHVAWVSAAPVDGGSPVLDWVLADPAAGLDLSVAINGEPATTPPGPLAPAGSPLSWNVTLTNIGSTTLTGIDVTASNGLTLSCAGDAIAASESLTCSGSSSAAASPQVYEINATAQSVSDGQPVAATARGYVGAAAGTP